VLAQMPRSAPWPERAGQQTVGGCRPQSVRQFPDSIEVLDSRCETNLLYGGARRRPANSADGGASWRHAPDHALQETPGGFSESGPAPRRNPGAEDGVSPMKQRRNLASISCRAQHGPIGVHQQTLSSSSVRRGEQGRPWRSSPGQEMLDGRALIVDHIRALGDQWRGFATNLWRLHGSGLLTTLHCLPSIPGKTWPI